MRFDASPLTVITPSETETVIGYVPVAVEESTVNVSVELPVPGAGMEALTAFNLTQPPRRRS